MLEGHNINAELDDLLSIANLAADKLEQHGAFLLFC